MRVALASILGLLAAAVFSGAAGVYLIGGAGPALVFIAACLVGGSYLVWRGARTGV